MPPSAYQDLGLPELPIDAVLGDLLDALKQNKSAVLVAPPGAGKTTRVPLAMLGEEWLGGGRIIVLEPRRIAARAAAAQMARLLGEQVGETVGFLVRMETKVGPETRIEVVTEGVFTRMLLADPELSGIAAVLFDEFHERSLEGDLGLALAIDMQAALRPDLRILPMSATMDGARVACLLDGAPVIESGGRQFPVDIGYKPMDPNLPLPERVARAIRDCLAGDQTGSILCFLPGQGEIHRTADCLGPQPDNIDLCLLYGALGLAEQDKAIRPPGPGRRKVVLATPIAETSLTIEGIATVIDSGLVRQPRYEPAVGMTRLETVRASRASIAQRAGRAGRLGPGKAIRLWQEGQTRALPEFDPPEIVNADLSGLLLDLADWGVTDPSSLKWLDQPPEAAMREAAELLRSLGAIDRENRILPEGREMRGLGLPPRLAAMILVAARHGQAETAAELAVLLGEQGLGGNDPDTGVRLEQFRSDRSPRADRARRMAKRIVKGIKVQGHQNRLSHGALLSIAWPERIGRKIRVVKGAQGEEAVFALSNGRQATLRRSNTLKRSDFIVATEVQGKAANATILSGGELSIDEIRELHGDRVSIGRALYLEAETGRPVARRRESLQKLVLDERPVPLEPSDDIAGLLLAHIRENGLDALPFGKQSGRLLARIRFAHRHRSEGFPDAGDKALLDGLEEWLLPFLQGLTSLDALGDHGLCQALNYYLGYDRLADLDRLAPAEIETPAGSRIPLDYDPDSATLRVRVQEMYGLGEHPAVMDGAVPVMLELLSPAMRPIQKTGDIAGFWEGSWEEVKKEMRGRYPKHFWPDDPANASATRRTKAAMSRAGDGG